MSLIGAAIRFYLERQSAHRSFDELTQQLLSSQASVSNRIFNAKESHPNHRRARQIVGIERWGQHRLRCALGEPLVLDRADDYILKNSHSGRHISQDFDSARRETLALIPALSAAPGIKTQTVIHNDIGPLSVKAWLVYLKMHAEIESMKLR